MDEKDDTLVKPSASPPQPPPKWKVWAKKPPTTEEAAAGDDDATKPTKDELKPVPYWQLFRYATFDVKLSLFISILNAVGHGTMLPMLTLIFGRIIDQIAFTFLPETNPNFVPLSEIASEIASTTRLFLILSFVAWVVSFFQLFFALRAANTLCNHLRFRFFSALLRQAPPFYDSHSPGSLSQLVISDISLIQAGVGDKLATAIQYITTFFAGLIVGFIKGWQLTLVILAVTPILLGSGFAFGQASSDATGDSLGSYAGANGIASEVLGLIRTVTTFSSQKSESKRYDTALKKAYKGSARASVMSGAGLGIAMFCILSSYGLAFWFGSLKVRSGEMQAGDVLITFFALTLGASSLGTAGPAFKSFSKARAAAPRVYEIIERISGIDPMDHEQGDIIPQDELKGRITFDHVDFNYPNRQFDDSEEAEKEDDLKNATGTNQSELVLNQFQLDIASGTSEALVGKSGCGKSTIARLIQRLYDPLSGCVRLDGVDIRSLNVRWLRSQIGVVAQTPSLFMLSIRDNIALGSGARFDRDATERTTVIEQEVSMEDIVKAAKLANAHDFIMKLPEGYDTMMGERGATLSGGQKQRVCIARALIRNPKILVLDESTASLDTESERIVQEALEKASEGRTTVTIAHRLSTVKNSNNISCIQQGQVVERGPHDALILKQDGYYKGLFELQDIEREKIQQEKEEEHEDAEGDNNALELQAPGTSEGIGKSTTQGPSDSLSKQQQPDGTDESNKKKGADIDKGLFMRTVKLNVGEWPLFLFGSLGSVAAGVVWPLTAIVLVNMIEILSKPEIIMSDVRFWALGFVVLAVGALIGNVLQHASLGVCGERLTLRLRSSVFLKLLQQEMGYFDAHSAGELTTLLANDVGLVKGLTSDLFGVAINVIASLVSGLLIAFLACWKLTLVVLAIIPGVALGGYFEMQASAGFDSGSRSELIKANTVAVESIDNIATVRATGKEQYFHSRFKDVIRSMNGSKLRKDGVTALAFGFSEFCQYLIWYATFKAGGNFMQDGSCSYTEILRSSMGLLFAAITLGNVSVFAPDLGASNLAATQVYRLLDRLSEIHPDGDGNQDDTQLTNVEGDVRASKVYFEYPTRPHTAVLRGLSLHARPGQTIAVVGQSGHGKSTIIALLERFYNVRAGSIKMDDVEISSVSPSTARSHIGLVSQLPELFNRSVFDNIAYGLPEGSAVTQGIVEDAAKQAFAHDFIMQLPQGYHTMVGERGEALSGGQRQRVAIARSLVRQPKVLLLDEATSALDGASERAVQKALDNAGKGRTTIVIAHRLSTIRHADKIVVVRRGKVAEVGTHDELLRKDGVYARLIENQLTEV